MLVIISDLHLADGTTGQTIGVGAFSAFRERLRDLAYDASWRSNGRYKPIDRLDLVLLGDILDIIRSTAWTDKGDVRPWHNPQDPDFINKTWEVTERVMQRNAAALAILRSLSQGNTITLPPATKKGLPARVSRNPSSSRRVPVNVKVHYMVGNHDWFYHLPGEAYDQIRAKIIEEMGLANDPGPFPHDLSESDELQSVFEEHELFARHGDIYDPFNYDEDGGRDRASLGDAMVIELFNVFPAQVESEMGHELPKGLLADLYEMGSITPSLLAPVWIDGVLHRYFGVTDQQRERINEIWDRLSDNLLEVDFVREQDKWFVFDAVDALETVLKFSRGFSFRKISELVLQFQAGIKGDGTISFAKHALTEEAFTSREAKFIVYGHTHSHEVVPLHSSIKNKRYFDQVYINSGTWHPLYVLARKDPREKTFVPYDATTYLAFYKGDERRGYAYETWSGVIGRG